MSGQAGPRGAVPPEYPRPQLRRDSYLNLNGLWEYAITGSDAQPETFDGEILVPYSPEAPLSGVGRSPGPDQFLWYRRRVTLPEGFVRARTLLHFGAVDQEAAVFVNGEQLAHHIGGYLPFSCDVTDALHGATEMEIVVCVRDRTDASYHTRRHLVYAAERHLADGLDGEPAKDAHPLAAHHAAV